RPALVKRVYAFGPRCSQGGRGIFVRSPFGSRPSVLPRRAGGAPPRCAHFADVRAGRGDGSRGVQYSRPLAAVGRPFLVGRISNPSEEDGLQNRPTRRGRSSGARVWGG